MVYGVGRRLEYETSNYAQPRLPARRLQTLAQHKPFQILWVR